MNVPNDPAGVHTSKDESDGTWSFKSESSSEDVDYDSDEGTNSVADSDFWEEDRAADTWLAQFPGGTPLLYPRLFIIKEADGRIPTPIRDPHKPCFQHLPPELRNEVYKHYFDALHVEPKYPEEECSIFLDRNGKKVKTIYFCSANSELKFWLSTALLKTSRQMRFEAMSILLKSHVFTTDWLPALPRLVEFLGKEGCAMVKYLDVWDSLQLQQDDSKRYRDIIKSISHFSHLQHLRIVLTPSTQSYRLRPWIPFDNNGRPFITQSSYKLRFEDIQQHWPEYEELKNLKAQKFTLAVQSSHNNECREFDRTYGAFPELSTSIQAGHEHESSKQAQASVSCSSSSQHTLEFNTIETKSSSDTLVPSSEFDKKPSDRPTWQDTDTLTNKTIPFYNFMRALFYRHVYLKLRWEGLQAKWVQDFAAFPTAGKSSGNIMRDCAFCYMNESHCGYHAFPDQPPLEKDLVLDAVQVYDIVEDPKLPQSQFEDMSYADKREACRKVVQHVRANDVEETSENDIASCLWNAVTIFRHIGWPVEVDSTLLLNWLDQAAKTGRKRKRVANEEVLPWDMLYIEFRAQLDSEQRGSHARPLNFSSFI